MGKKLLLLLALLLSMLLSISGCSSKNENRQSQKNRSYEHISFTSSIAANDCLLCSDISDHQLPWYLGQDNLGFVAVNSFVGVFFIVGVGIGKFSQMNEAPGHDIITPLDLAVLAVFCTENRGDRHSHGGFFSNYKSFRA